MTPSPLVELKSVSKAFRVNRERIVHALQDVSLYARAGEFVTLIGPSGCGKSTLLNIISGLMEPDEGAVLLRGRSEGERLGRSSHMPQRDLLLPWRTVLQNILLGPELRGHDLVEARQEARSLLPLFGLEGFEDHYPATLSGGMRQRAALMRTFMCQQELILLDEPLGALDALTRRTMRRWMMEVWTRLEQTTIFVTHDVEEAISLSDRIYVLSPRPGHVAHIVEVDLPRPRQDRASSQPRYATYRDDILAHLGL